MQEVLETLIHGQSTLAVLWAMIKFSGLADFKLYPNPNKGNFTVQFDSKSSNDIKISVNDISGRQIFKRSYQNTGLFNEKLQLENIQSGIYLVTVQDGDRKEVKKIVVE